MKKLGLFVLAVLTVGFTACKKDNPVTPDLDNVVSDGMYVLGEAVGVTDINKAVDLLMCQGVNEKLMDVDKKKFEEAKRIGMYEKYLYLDANKPFYLVYLDGEKTTNYGGQLAEAQITTDLGQVPGYWCALQENVQMQVPVDGFYHVVLDLNLNEGDLDAAGGAQIIVAPVSWGISGGMNGWGMTVGEKAGDKNLTTWTWDGLEIAAGTEFKFKDQNGWKIWLDGETQQVSAHSNLGAEMKQGGDNIQIAEGGVYKLVLSWKLAKGDMANSYSYQLIKSGDLVLNPADFVIGISGSMNNWNAPAGVTLAKYDENASTVTDQTTKAGTYVYNISGLTFTADAQFKFRQDGNWLGLNDVEIVGVTPSEADGNITGVDGCYNIKITIVWDGSIMTTYKAEFSEGTPAHEYVSGKIFLKNNGTLTNLNIYGWAPDKDNNNDIFGAWPGTPVGGDAKDLTQIFYDYGIKNAEYKFIINGTGGQTSDPDWTVVVDGETSISLIITEENQLILGE